MVKIYSPKLTEAQYFHVMDAMGNHEIDVYEEAENSLLEGTVKLHERTKEALMKAQDK
tara:strand:- start:879 stop:1052 length:174 start_codon:yes stop_codon:yes gene_type:complete